MHRKATIFGVFALAIALVPSTARAQSAMTGIVKDTSGAVLPGVIVEAASEALIERSKTGITDGEGRYNISDLRPGIYVVTFALPGFATVRREGIALPASFIMTLNGELRIGGLEESITVSGDAPVVDVSSTARTTVLPRDVLDAIPTGRTIQSLAQLVPGVQLSAPDVGGSRAMQQTYMSVHGMSASQVTCR